ncbi:hypothetical protein BJV82DRAFT_613340 [Fennellomyces sp. T-0311]|nr:hypothetical protein BJV82DRAFT_613340 [Fennellomyces sp. T-0311]
MQVIGQTAILLAVANTVLCNGLYPAISHDWQPRQNKPDITACPLEKGISTLGDIYNHFMVLNFNSILDAKSGFAGPVASNGTYSESSTEGTTVARENPADCQLGANDIYSYGLVARSSISTKTTLDVYGNIYSPSAVTGDVNPVGESCSLESSKSPIDFTSLYDGLLTASKYLYDLSPDYKFDDVGKVTRISDQPAHPSYHVFTLDSCASKSPQGTCSGQPADSLSSPNGILGGRSEWSGPDLSEIIDDGLTIVVNIPVTENLGLPIPNDNISIGFPTCRTIFNIYTVTAETSEFSTSRSTASLGFSGDGLFEGLILAPKVTSLVYPQFGERLGGKWFSKNVYSPGRMIEDFGCGSYQGCFPVADHGPPDPSSSSTSESSSTSCDPETTTMTETTTKTTSVETLTTTDTAITTVTHKTTVDVVTTVLTSTVPTTLLSTATLTFTTTDTSDLTTTTRIFTSLTTVIVPVENEWPPSP